MKILLIAVLLMVFLPLRAQTPIPESAKTARTVFVDTSSATNLSRDAIDLALSTSNLRRKEDKESADLTLSYDRHVVSTNRTETGNQISIGIQWDYTLNVVDSKGQLVWKSSAPLDTSNLMHEHSEDAWIAFLRKTPEYKLTKAFLASKSN